ncbi:MAG TPA: hypothetical protein GXX26_00075 [Clostridiaceae bacterium]|nr:hypothetical protein [Clostridiaceae bacterium]
MNGQGELFNLFSIYISDIKYPEYCCHARFDFAGSYVEDKYTTILLIARLRKHRIDIDKILKERLQRDEKILEIC